MYRVILMSMIAPSIQAVEATANEAPTKKQVSTVLDAITTTLEAEKSKGKSGDDLTAHVIRQAAGAALKLPERQRNKAFLIGLGIGMDPSRTLTKNALTKLVFGKYESAKEAESRADVVRKARLTMMGRSDLTLHFSLSCALTATGGPKGALLLGQAKEMRDADGGSGFSFKDMAANMAGIALAERLLDGKIDLKHLGERATVRALMPSPEGLPEGLSLTEFRKQYGSVSDPRYRREIDRIEQRVAAVFKK